MGKLIDELGGVDICFGGIGINGHLAFNEAQDELSPEQFKALHTRVLKITPETRTANAIGDFCGRLDDMPHWCVTIGMHEIYHARKIRLGCFRDWQPQRGPSCGLWRYLRSLSCHTAPGAPGRFAAFHRIRGQPAGLIETGTGDTNE